MNTRLCKNITVTLLRCAVSPLAFLLVFAIAFPNAYATQPSGAGSTQLGDVAQGDWYHNAVIACLNKGLVFWEGNSFSPSSQIKANEGIAIVSNLHQYLNNAAIHGRDNPDWLVSGWRYARTNGILGTEHMEWGQPELGQLEWGQLEWGQPINRESFIALILKAMPSAALSEINDIDSIPGYFIDTEFGEGVLSLYKAGILVGDGAQGYFSPYKPITRAEVAAILCRVIDRNARVSISGGFSPDPRAKATRLPFGAGHIAPNEIKEYTGNVVITFRDIRTAGASHELIKHTVYDIFGKVLVDYEGSANFSESNGVIRCANEDGVSYFNLEGARINNVQYNWGSHFNEDELALAFPWEGNPQGYVIDSAGNIKHPLNMGIYSLLRFSAETRYVISAGYIPVSRSDSPFQQDQSLMSITTGEVTELRPKFERIEWPFLNGLAAVQLVDPTEGWAKSPAANIIDTDLNVILPRNFDQIVNYSPDVTDSFIVGELIPQSGRQKYGVVNRNADILVPMEYDRIGTLSNKGHAYFYKINDQSDARDELTVRNYRTNEAIAIHSSIDNSTVKHDFANFLYIDIHDEDSGDNDMNDTKRVIVDIFGNHLTPVINSQDHIWESSNFNGSALYLHEGAYYILEYER